MTKIPTHLFNLTRLQKLHDFIKEDQKSVDPFLQFDFGYVNYTHEVNIDRTSKLQTKRGVHNCGSLGCMLGYLPAVFPDNFAFSNKGSLVGKPDLGYYSLSVQKFFSLLEEQYLHIFMPCSQIGLLGKELTELSSVEEVLANLQDFIDHYHTDGHGV